MSKIAKLISGLITVAIMAWSPAALAAAGNGSANLSLSPSNGSFTTGKTFAVGIYVNSSAQIASAQADIHYDTNKLECLGVDGNGSAFAQHYNLACGSGFVNVARGVQGQTVSGSSKLATITFKVLAAGSTSLTFAGSSEIFDGSAASACDASCNEGAHAATFGLSAPAATPAAAKPSAPRVAAATTPAPAAETPAPAAQSPAPTGPQFSEAPAPTADQAATVNPADSNVSAMTYWAVLALAALAATGVYFRNQLAAAGHKVFGGKSVAAVSTATQKPKAGARKK